MIHESLGDKAQLFSVSRRPSIPIIPGFISQHQGGNTLPRDAQSQISMARFGAVFVVTSIVWKITSWLSASLGMALNDTAMMSCVDFRVLTAPCDTFFQTIFTLSPSSPSDRKTRKKPWKMTHSFVRPIGLLNQADFVLHEVGLVGTGSAQEVGCVWHVSFLQEPCHKCYDTAIMWTTGGQTNGRCSHDQWCWAFSLGAWFKNIHDSEMLSKWLLETNLVDNPNS